MIIVGFEQVFEKAMIQDLQYQQVISLCPWNLIFFKMPVATVLEEMLSFHREFRRSHTN